MSKSLVKIGQYIDYQKGKAPVETFDSFKEGFKPYLSPEFLRGISQPLYVEPNGRLVEIGDSEVIVLWDGSNAGEIFISKEGILASTMTKLIIDEEEFDKLYFIYSMKYLEYILKAKTAGSGIPHVDKGILKNLEVYKPEKPEQKAIAKILSTVDDLIQATKETITKAERLKKSLMQNLLSGKLKPDGTWRTEDEFYVDEKYGKIPKTWSYKKLGSVFTECQYGLSKAMNETGKYPIFRMNNIENGKMIAAPMAYIDLSNKEFEKYKVNKGDILINRTNSLELVGKVGIFDLEGE
jgi:type I restriction enzyme S subunit